MGGLADKNYIKTVNDKITQDYSSVRNCTIALMGFTVALIVIEIVTGILTLKVTSFSWILSQAAYSVEGILFLMLIYNYNPGKIAVFRRLVVYSTLLEILFLIKIVFDILKLDFAPMGYLYHLMIIITIIWLWNGYVKMKTEVDDKEA